MNLQGCRNVNREEVCTHFTTNAICFLISPSCITERDDNQDVSLKSHPLKKSEVQFPSYCRVQEHDSPRGLNLLLIHESRKVGNHSYFHKCFPPPSVFLTLNMLLGTSSERHGLLKKRRINFVLVLAPSLGIRTSSATNDDRLCSCC